MVTPQQAPEQMPKEESKLWEIFAIAGLIFGPLTVAMSWQELPSQIPMHFGFFGNPDYWAAKESILFLPVFSVATYRLFSFAQKHPERSNLPWKPTDVNRTEMFALVTRLLTTLKIVVLVMLSYLQWAIVNVALGHVSGLGVWFGPVVLIATFSPIVVFLISGRKLNAVKQ